MKVIWGIGFEVKEWLIDMEGSRELIEFWRDGHKEFCFKPMAFLRAWLNKK